jgi:TPP-dependent pyruvate/acetoin dehydrogenase alpha subunit
MVLGNLANPEFYCDNIDITGFDKAFLMHQLKTMLLIRRAEEKISDMVGNGTIKCPCHLGIGQEAIATGISAALRKTDKVFGAHRSHSHFLALNHDIFGLFAEVLGRVEGVSRGMGGSMHIIDKANGFYGSVPIVGATVPIATGAGLASKLEKKGNIAVSYFGDGSTEEGGVQESLNLASSMQLPVLFVCENNLFSSHLHISLRQPSNSVGRYAAAHGIEHRVIDGNDAVLMYNTTQEALKMLRQGKGPFFIEAVTYRWKGHVGHRDDIDVGVNRNAELNVWKKRDPIRRLLNAMQIADMITEADFDALDSQIIADVESAWTKATQSPFPPKEALLDWVYAD